ncbi:Uncharacterised protein [Mycobacterium tuberculosis]|uniref:Uncharacterized protein n=1 Tax=Mycobacterium tuberculosis TaxID=1773 RepID=A0A654ZBH6_MYCTX|nr:Uncharacterised protein [Mycobacterium tuberculosis]CKO10821.1 Uncharacterised protein [Mycobacterium tuberculosis]COX09175.1 Uncharacterised protein [Mycobacterium tuberculosis]SGO30789.1 Uncharacterised protein [Mycobacterium tuberculosis]
MPNPNTCTASGIDLASADTNMLIRTPLRRLNIRLLAKKNSSADTGLSTSGALCSIRPRWRSTEISLRRSRQVAKVDGSARERKRSPSSLSIAASIPDMPSIPASSASSSSFAIFASSASVGRTVSSVARSRPSTAVRRSEWPSSELTFGPRGRASIASMYSAGVDHVWLSRRAPRTNSRGTASTRLNRSAASSELA